MTKYSLVIPVFNEEQVIKESYLRIKKAISAAGEDYELIYINDGSTDLTDSIIKSFCSNDSHVKLISFSRNFGHQIAISAGLDYASGDAVIVIDADLQDPPEVILEMIKKWKEGFDVVYGKRIERKGETLFKKFTAFAFYRLLKFLTREDLPVDSGDFRLIDKKVCNAIKELSEKSRYMRGLMSWIGFKQAFVTYKREERKAGKTKYPLRKMIHFAIDAITSFSYRPLRLASYLGIIFSIISFILITIVIYQKLFTNSTIVGWASIIAVTLFFNSLTLIILGIIGEYIGRIYEEAKGRPLYIVKNKIGFD